MRKDRNNEELAERAAAKLYMKPAARLRPRIIARFFASTQARFILQNQLQWNWIECGASLKNTAKTASSCYCNENFIIRYILIGIIVAGWRDFKAKLKILEVLKLQRNSKWCQNSHWFWWEKEAVSKKISKNLSLRNNLPRYTQTYWKTLTKLYFRAVLLLRKDAQSCIVAVQIKKLQLHCKAANFLKNSKAACRLATGIV